MKLKQRVGDFKVRELLREDYVLDRGPVRVYRVTKRKLTTPEAVVTLAAEAGVKQEQVGTAGLKDRQGITVQHMSVVDGRDVSLDVDGLRIEPVGFADAPITSADSLGNAFDINVRALSPGAVSALRSNLETVREGGVPNYFDDQRFGNLRAGQGWVAKDLALGKIEGGLRRLLCEPSPFDDDRHARLKRSLDENWGDWHECLDVARRLGVHRSLFEHLVQHPGDFGEAFRFIAARTRLIHLFAWQSHVWNRAVAGWVRDHVAVDDRVVLESVEGPLVCPGSVLDAKARGMDFPLPGAGLDGVNDPVAEALLTDALAEQGLVPDQFRIEGVPGFQLKPEGRPLFVVPRHLRVRPSVPDPENRGGLMVRLRFELPRGAYATLVVKRLCATRVGAEAEEEEPRSDRKRRDHDARKQREDQYRSRGGDGERSGDRRQGGRDFGGRDFGGRGFRDRDDGRGGRGYDDRRRDDRGWGREDRRPRGRDGDDPRRGRDPRERSFQARDDRRGDDRRPPSGGRFVHGGPRGRGHDRGYDDRGGDRRRDFGGRGGGSSFRDGGGDRGRFGGGGRDRGFGDRSHRGGGRHDDRRPGQGRGGWGGPPRDRD
ncbi:MAG: tRNA pseudouridine(13) synthase TruD, partial [Planctomycetota bacterium]